jgi:hypothetical protein|tara:strand:+ start:22322 stop:22807 length:486 start_codon:yes stop_codon:yes gene_type:complete
MITVIDNYLPPEVYEHLYDHMVNDDHFMWVWSNGVNAYKDGHKQFVHTIYNEYKPQSWFFDHLTPIFEKLQATSIIRVKLNLQPQDVENTEQGLHIDNESPTAKTAIIYFGTNNGYTKFADGQTIETVANRAVIFPSSYQHSGATCTDASERIVLNINYHE